MTGNLEMTQIEFSQTVDLALFARYRMNALI